MTSLLPLQLLGLYPWIWRSVDKPSEPTVTIGPDGAVVIKEPSVASESGDVRGRWITTIYLLLLFALIGWEPIFGLTRAISRSDGRYFSVNTYQMLVVSQLLIGRRYFHLPHFYDVVKEHTDQIVSLKLIVGGLVTVSLITAATALVLLLSGIDVTSYSELFDSADSTERLFLGLLLLVEKAFSNLMFTVNAVAFLIVFGVIKGKIGHLEEQIENWSNDPEMAHDTTIADDYLTIRHDHQKAVEYLNKTFASLNLGGLLHLSFVIINHNSGFVTVLDYVNLGFIVVIAAVYYRTITQLSDAIDGIRETTKTKKVFNQSVQRYPFSEPDPDDAKAVRIQLGVRVDETSAAVRWLINDRFFSADWAKFSIGPIEVENTEVIETGFGYLVAILLGLNILEVFGFKFADED